MIPSVKFPSDTFKQPQTARSKSARPNSVFKGSLDALFLAALETPIGFPPLKEFVFDGDKIALVLLGHLPDPEQCAASVLNAIAKLINHPEVVVVSSARLAVDWDEFEQNAGTKLADNLAFTCQTHDPNDTNAVAYIAASTPGEPIYINRAIFDADIVISIGVLDENGWADGPPIYPEFSSANTMARFRDECSIGDLLRQETIIANQHLGADLSILIVAEPGERISNAFCGHVDSIRKLAQQDSGNSWSLVQQSAGQVVVATIESNPRSQTWEQFFLALQSAAVVSDKAQQIVICTAIGELPDPLFSGILQLQFESDQETIQRQLAAVPAQFHGIPAILQESSVYLKSQLAQEDVEELGLGYIESDQQIQRIVDRAESGILLRDAHLCKIV